MPPATANARMRIVDDHIRFESTHDLEPLVATFGDKPEWHIQAGEQVLHGHDAIRSFYADLFKGFPNFSLEIRRKHEAKEAVIVEGVLGGTHTGAWMGIAATGKTVAVPFCAVFTFTPNDRLKAEIVYYDALMLMTQLGVITLP